MPCHGCALDCGSDAKSIPILKHIGICRACFAQLAIVGVVSSPSTQAASQVSSPLWRRIVASLLAVVAIIAIVLSLVVGWAKTTLTDEDQFVSTLADLPANDAVATTLSVRIADRIVERTGMTDFVVRVLPDQLEFLAASLTTAVTNTVADVTYEAITSDGFSTLR